MICEVKGIVVMDADGTTIYSKYYNPESNLSSKSSQAMFEHQLFNKSSKMTSSETEADIFVYDKYSIVFRHVNDLFVFLYSTYEDNEILLACLLDSITEALEILYRSEIDKGTITKQLDLLMLAVDEFVDDGIIVCCDSVSIIERVLMRDNFNQDLPLKSKKGESALERAINKAKNAIIKRVPR